MPIKSMRMTYSIPSCTQHTSESTHTHTHAQHGINYQLCMKGLLCSCMNCDVNDSVFIGEREQTTLVDQLANFSFCSVVAIP